MLIILNQHVNNTHWLFFIYNAKKYLYYIIINNFYCGIPSPNVRSNFRFFLSCVREEEEQPRSRCAAAAQPDDIHRLPKYSGQCNHSNVPAIGHNRLRLWHTDMNSLFINARVLCPSATMIYIDKCPLYRLSLVKK